MTSKHPKHAVTEPKNRPTPSRNGGIGQARILTSTFQWSAAFGAILVALIVLVLVTR
jgi:hypothetical protein